MSGFRPSVIASVVLGLMTRMVRFVGALGAMIAAGVPECFKRGVLVFLVLPMDVLWRQREGGYWGFLVTFCWS
jgi:hypothetical protein